MPIKEPDIYAQIWAFIQTHLSWNSTVSFALTFFIAIFRICYVGREHSKIRMAAESLLCGTLAVASESVFEYLGMPAKLAVAFGAIIALFGIDELRRMAKIYMAKRMNGRS